MMVDDIKRNLEVSFNQNPSFKAENLSRDNTVEDKIFSYAIKMTSQFTLDLNNFYEKMKTFELRPLSIYANKGLVSYIYETESDYSKTVKQTYADKYIKALDKVNLSF